MSALLIAAALSRCAKPYHYPSYAELIAALRAHDAQIAAGLAEEGRKGNPEQYQ